MQAPSPDSHQAPSPCWHELHLDHEGLLTLARKVHTAAEDHDASRLEQAAGHLLAALDTHLADEAIAMTRLCPAEARVLKRGQARLSRVAAALLVDATHGCADGPERCTGRAEEMLGLLVLQARDEHLAGCDRAA